MGCQANISAVEFPAQGKWSGKSVRVCFNYDTSKCVLGEIVRDDVEAPGLMIIRLEDGRHVLATECQWQPVAAD